MTGVWKAMVRGSIGAAIEDGGGSIGVGVDVGEDSSKLEKGLDEEYGLSKSISKLKVN